MPLNTDVTLVYNSHPTLFKQPFMHPGRIGLLYERYWRFPGHYGAYQGNEVSYELPGSFSPAAETVIHKYDQLVESSPVYLAFPEPFPLQNITFEYDAAYRWATQAWAVDEATYNAYDLHDQLIVLHAAYVIGLMLNLAMRRVFDNVLQLGKPGGGRNKKGGE